MNVFENVGKKENESLLLMGHSSKKVNIKMTSSIETGNIRVPDWSERNNRRNTRCTKQDTDTAVRGILHCFYVFHFNHKILVNRKK